MNKSCILYIICVLALGLFSVASAQTVVTEFTGSEALGRYSSDYDELNVLTRDDEGKLSPQLIEGQLSSRIYKLPDVKSVVEFKRNYEKTLKENNFEILTTLQNPAGADVNAIRSSNKNNRINKRKYQPKVPTMTLARIDSQMDYYLYAQRTEEKGQRNILILFNEAQGFYLIDEMITATMQTDMVRITEDALKTALANEGKIAVYDIFFATGSAEIENTSKQAMDVIGSFMNNNPEINVYVVGHTDDTGSFANNMALSQQRAKSVVDSLVNQYGIDASRMQAGGVGPLAPVANNTTDAGKQQNRRVELVRRLK